MIRKAAKKAQFNNKVSKYMKEISNKGVRKNTKAAISKSNPRRPVSHEQMIAIALSKARKASQR